MSCSTHALVKKTSTVVMHCSWIKLSWRAISSDRRILFSSETDDSWVENPWKTVFSVASLISLSIKHGPGWLSVRAHWSSSTPAPSVSCSSLVYALGKFPHVSKEKPVVHSCSCQSPLLCAWVKDRWQQRKISQREHDNSKKLFQGQINESSSRNLFCIWMVEKVALTGFLDQSLSAKVRRIQLKLYFPSPPF